RNLDTIGGVRIDHRAMAFPGIGNRPQPVRVRALARHTTGRDILHNEAPSRWIQIRRSLPAIEPWPGFDLAVRADGLIGGMLCAGGTRVIGQYPKARPDRKAFLDLVIRRTGPGDNPVLLVRTAHQILAKHLSVFAAHESVTKVAVLALGATVAAHGHPPRIDDGPAF